MQRISLQPCFTACGETPLAHILRLGDVTLLLDAGWTTEYLEEDLAELRSALPSIDAVLVSHADVAHLGALPALLGQGDRTLPVYITGAAHKMGQMELYEECLVRSGCSEFTAFSLDHIDAAFDGMTTLNYLQHCSFVVRDTPVRIVAHPAGHRLGGAIWHIQWSNEDIVYAVGFNHRKERHLAGAQLPGIVSRPALLIVDGANAAVTAAPSATQNADFLEAVVATLRSEGNVLIPVDAAGRVLELLLLLEHHWAQHHLPYSLAWLSSMGASTLEFAKTQTEWMSESLCWHGGRLQDNPYLLRHVRPCADAAALARMGPGPKAVLASLGDLGAGGARELLAAWGAAERSTALELAADFTAEQQPQRANTGTIGVAGAPEQAQQRTEGAGALAARHACLVDGFAVPEGCCSPMFPFPEKPEARDAYGTIDTSVVFEEDVASGPGTWDPGAGVAPAAADAGAEGAAPGPPPPTKVVEEDASFNLRALVLAFDYEGLVDGRSLRTIVGQVAPRHCALLGRAQTESGRQALETLKRQMVDDLAPLHGKIHGPLSPGENLDIPCAPSVRVEMEGRLVASLETHAVSGCKLAWLRARRSAADPGLLEPAEDEAQHATLGGVFIGDVKLSEVRKALLKASIPAEFSGGALYCEGPLVIRRSEGEGAGLSLEGPLSEQYHRVQQVIYAQYHVC
ncbi:Cleavage and polyadenylation specificity factor subunit 2 [Auxenochlorella protothecoides]|uniref:Cleavage and polyadenylation specificity factor subunit 2 n=1 Tax=Auxenochlorella protothecoides TaxID=3075 RepID=A0A087SAX1_AUXPR|nr:Cleavage and polyadenylation specificity factor subunit 2 [Auxenochlorella protothecoides]KFM22875.1 Cleavage and polyadenylation specificity factor subunit 2 [Auxenochlorella protothecoides]